MTKETIGIRISNEIMDFIKKGIENKQFADVSHAFELMAFEYMKSPDVKDESTLGRLERLTMSTVQKSVDTIKTTAETVQESSIGKGIMQTADRVEDTTMKAYNETTDKFRESSAGKGIMETAGKVQDATMKAYNESTEKVMESSIGKDIKDTANKVQDTTMKGVSFTTDKVKESMGVVRDRISPNDDEECCEGHGKDSEKGKKIEIEE